MRTLTPAARTKLETQYGTEPIIIVEIEWVPGGQRCAYADRNIAASVRGQIVEIGSVDAAIKVNGTTDSTQMQLVLEDVDGAIKALCDAHDLHKRPVWVYQWFDGLELTDRFLLFKGEINSPLAWNEGDRTVSFDVTTRIEDVEAGFSMEEGEFPVVPSDALGKAWPLVFGSVCDVKAVQVRAPRYGILQSGEGIHDYTLESRICQARHIQCPNSPLGTAQVIIESERPDLGVRCTADNVCYFAFETETEPQWGPDQSCVEDRHYTICNLLYQLQQQQAYEHATMTVRGATTIFPQGERITLNIEGGKFTGVFSGDVFTIERREHPDYATNPPTPCVPIRDRTYGISGVLEGGGWTQTASGTAWSNESQEFGIGNFPTQDFDTYCNEAMQTSAARAASGGPVDSQRAFDDMKTAAFFWARAGSKVYLEGEDEVLFIVDLLPCTITRVAAYKQTPFGPMLTTVPAEYYTIYETDYDGYTVTEIGMPKPLSQRSEMVTYPDGTTRLEPSKWSDDIYVTLTSSVGPNPVDIIAWLLAKYTSYTADAASFASVKARLTNYPCQFALLERKNVMELVGDIALQSRCAVVVRNDVVYMKYLSEEPTSVATVTESAVLANSLKISLTNTDDVATKHVVSWWRNQTEGEQTIILKHNVAKYGVHEKRHDYYTHNIFNNALKSATFWMIRDANVWKQVEFSAPLKYLDMEVFDCVTLDLADVAAIPVKAVVTAIKYDPGNEQIDFTCWTPIRAGDAAPYPFAWPADLPAGTVFPPEAERAAGMGYAFTVAPPAGHLLYVVRPDDGNTPAVLSSGDALPSDLDDVLETCFCPATDTAVVEELDPVFVALRKAEKANRDQMQAKMDAPAASSGPSDKDDKPQRVCGQPAGSGVGCVYEVRVTYLTADMVRLMSNGCDPPCGRGARGAVCTGASTEMCHSFGARFSAEMFAAQMRSLAASYVKDCNGSQVVYCQSGETVPYVVSGPTALGTECEDAPGDSTAPNQGETYQPSPTG